MGVIGRSADVTYPDIVFHPWHRWKDRRLLLDEPFQHEIEHADTVRYGAVYLFGHFTGDELKEKPVSWTAEGVIYIGFTQNVRNRPIRGHNKIPDYKKKFSDPYLRHLFVSLFDVAKWGMWDRLTPPQMAFLKYVERKVIWEYADKWGDLPALNSE